VCHKKATPFNGRKLFKNNSFILLVKGGRKETNEDVACRTRIRVAG